MEQEMEKKEEAAPQIPEIASQEAEEKGGEATVEVSEDKVEKVEEKDAPKKEAKKWDCKLTKLCKKGGWRTVILLAGLVVVMGASLFFAVYYKKKDIGPVAAKTKLEKFINENLVAPGTNANIKDIVKEGDLYKVTIGIGTQSITAYLTQDGSKFFPQMIDMNAKPSQDANNQAATAEKTEAENKTDVPTVDLFVMSYCPYGLQMERGVLPAIEALGNKIKFNLKFVYYTLHGPKEVTENVNQYCIEKTQSAKLDSYLKCFWKDSSGKSDACMKAVGVNAAQISSCVADTNKQFNPTEKDFSLNKEDNSKYGVQGSPTLVVNGTTISSNRDSASVLKAICSGFSKQPKECQAKLSSTSPVAGFDDQAAAAGASGTANGGCASPSASTPSN